MSTLYKKVVLGNVLVGWIIDQVGFYATGTWKTTNYLSSPSLRPSQANFTLALPCLKPLMKTPVQAIFNQSVTVANPCFGQKLSVFRTLILAVGTLLDTWVLIWSRSSTAASSRV
jgi:hypothetical protein